MTDQLPAAYISSRRVGGAVITIVSEGSFMGPAYLEIPEVEWRPGIPEADERGLLRYGFNIAHIQFGDASILIDPSGIDDPSSAMYTIRTDEPSFIPTPGLHAMLTHRNINPEAITHVLITHAHDDHFCGVTTERNGQRVARYPHARYYIGRGDWDSDPTRDDEVARCLRPLEQSKLLETVAVEHEIIPGVTMILAPGETPGHCIVRVRSQDETFYYLGDLFFYPAHVEHPEWVVGGRDKVVMPITRNRVSAEVAANQALLVFTHAPFPGWGRIISTEADYRWVWV